MAKVYNKRDKNIPFDAVYVGRPTIFGNPYTHLKRNTNAGVLVDTREEAIEAYRAWFNTRLEDPEFADAVGSLYGHDLICWCSPASCHAEVILEYLEGD